MRRFIQVLKLAGLAALVASMGMAVSAAAPATAAASSGPADWPMYLHDGQLTAASSESILTPSTVPNLRTLWKFKTGSLISASATVVGGVAYVGSWDGYEYAINAATGALIWKTFLGITTAPTCAPPSIGVASVAAVVNGVVYVGGGDSNWYALDAGTGAVLWTVPTGDNSAAGGHYNWASPLIVGNSAYIGIASLGDCPLVQGQLLRVDLTTHAVAATVNFVPTGQVGGGVWTTPAIDTGTNTVYVTTGTLNNPAQTMSESMVAVDATTLAVKSFWQIPRSAANSDSDWGNSPILFSDGNNRPMVAGINKNGFLYAFDRSNLALGPIWSTQLAIGGICPTCGDGSVASMAFAQGLLFAAGGNTTIGGVGYPGAVRAIDPTTGVTIWAHGLADPVIPALAYDNGMVLAGSGPRLEVFDAGTGARLASYATGAVTYSPPTISNGVVFMGSGDTNLYAFAPVAPVVPPADANCPAGLVCQDIGAPTPTGSETVTSGSWAIAAGGAGLGLAGGVDQFRFMSQTASGDLQITARLAAQTRVSNATETGLMVRQANDPNSPFFAVSVTGAGTIAVQSRSSFGGTLKTVTAAGAVLPLYLEIQRIGDKFAAATSTDGVNFTLVAGGSATVTMPTGVMAGIQAASGTNGTAGSATVDTVVEGAPGAAPSPAAPTTPCPAGWSCGDVGNPAAVGGQSLGAGVWTITGAGNPTGANAYNDQFHFVWQALAADGTLSARVATQPNTAATAQAGVAFRADTTAGAVFYGAFLTPGNGIQVVDRTSAGMRTNVVATTTATAPAYLEITRYQNTYTTFTSSDGVTWNALVGSSVTFGSGGAMLAGLLVNSGSGSTLATDTLDSVSLATSASPPPSLCPTNWTCQDIGFPTPGAGSQYVIGSNWTVQAGGADIWGVADAFRLLSQPLTGDGSVSARVDSQSVSSDWAKAGVMLRSTNDPGSPYFAVLVTPSHGIAVQWRSTQGGSSSQVTTTGTAPAWIEVTRSGGTFTAYTSPDGTTWTAIPGASVSLGITTPLMAGLAVTSHNGGAMGTVTFDTATVAATAPPPPGACPTGWSCLDIGNTGVAGAQSLTAGTWTIQGGGGDIWDVADNFHYAYQSMATDGSLTARLTAQSNTSIWAKAGVMMRASTDPGSPYYAAFLTPANGVAVQWRSALAGATSQVLTPGTTPVYLRAARNGGSYSAYTSPDGTTWTLVPGSTVNLGLTGTVLAGLAVTSHSWGVLGSATIDSVAFSQLPPPWLDTDIGAPAIGGSASSTSPVFTIAAGGTDIYGTADQMHYAYQPATGDSTLSTRIVSQTNTSSWAKAGPMFRSTTNAGSPYYALFATPANGIVTQWRSTQGASTSQIKTTGTVPVYLRITRAGNVFSSYTSADGSTWTLVPGSTVTLALPSALLAGLAATSHNGAKLGTVTFDNFSLTGSAPPPPNDFSIAASPSAVSVTAGSAGSTAIGTTLVSGSAEAIALSASGLPAGVTAGFSPSSVTAGGPSTLTLTVASSATPGVYPVTVTGTAPSATHATTVTLTVVAPPPPLPSPWVDTDVGAPALAGSAAYATGVFTVNGAGADIFGTSDQFHYVYQPTTGNGTLIARVASQTNAGSTNDKAGIIWKASTAAGSPYVLIAVNYQGLVKVQYNFSNSVTSTTFTYPNVWMKLVRSGSTFTASVSPDGTTWTQVLSKSLTTIPTAATVGIFECSHNAAKIGTATFDNVSFVAGP